MEVDCVNFEVLEHLFKNYSLESHPETGQRSEYLHN